MHKAKFAVSERVRQAWRIREAIERGKQTAVWGVVMVLWGVGFGLRTEPWAIALGALAVVTGAAMSVLGLRAARRAERELAEHRHGWSADADDHAPPRALPR